MTPRNPNGAPADRFTAHTRPPTRTGYAYRRRPVSPNPSATWFNPRRRMNAEKLVDYLRQYGLKCWLNDWGYPHLEKYADLEPWHIDQAVDDLYTLGAVDVRATGNGAAVELLVESLDEILPSGPAAAGVSRVR